MSIDTPCFLLLLFFFFFVVVVFFFVVVVFPKISILHGQVLEMKKNNLRIHVWMWHNY